MDFADGGDLLQNIKKRQGEPPQWFEEAEVWDYAIQMVKGLKSLHDRSILHRDLKSANIFLYQSGMVKIGDLNVSKIMREKLSYT